MQRPEENTRTITSASAYAVIAGFINSWCSEDKLKILLYPLTNRGAYGFDFDSGPMPISVFSNIPDVMQSIADDYERNNQEAWLLDFDRLRSLVSDSVQLNFVSPPTPDSLFAGRSKETVSRVSYPGFSEDGLHAGLYFDAYGKGRSQIGWSIGLILRGETWTLESQKALFH
ncbi:MAG: hypothetical protein JNM27_21425 [Leptospirales bacterium]|nr:hypothetical protein [Leptospirales bacterium]